MTNETYRKQKIALTRARNSGDPLKVLAACRDAVQQWEEDGPWPDAWYDWRRAALDAQTAIREQLWGLTH